MSNDSRIVTNNCDDNGDDEIICWKRPRRKIRLQSFEKYTSTPGHPIISPKTMMTSSSISAITFDETLLDDSVVSLNLSHSHGCDGGDNRVKSKYDHQIIDTIDRQKPISSCSDAMKSHSEDKCCTKGSLYSRITNGYTDRMKEKSLEIKKEEDRGSEDEKVAVVDEVHSNIEEGSEGNVQTDRFENEDKAYEGRNEISVEDNELEEILETCSSSYDSTISHPSTKEDGSKKSTPTSSPLSDLLTKKGDEIEEDGTENSTPKKSMSDSTFCKIKDEWREVRDVFTGKSYFYNRRTRESRWNLPPNAILLRKRRIINHLKRSNSPREVSMTASDMTMTDSCGSSYTCSLYEEGTASIRYDNGDTAKSSETISCYNDHGIDANSSCIETIEKDHSGSFIERCKRLRKPIQAQQRLNFFSPDKSARQNFKDEEIVQNDELATDNCISDINTLTNLDSAFCIYCGAKFECATKMISHLQKDCAVTLTMSQDHIDDICHFVENVCKFDNQRGNEEGDDTTTIHQECENHQECEKENIPTSLKKDQTGHSQNGKSLIFTDSDEEDTVTDFHLAHSRRRKDKKNRVANNTSFEEKYLSNESTIRSKCPFCSKTFPNGSDLSKHLLKCNERQLSGKKLMNIQSHFGQYSNFLNRSW